MKTLIIVVAAIAILSGSAIADSYTTNRVGNFAYTNGPHGYNATETDIGNFRYYNDNQGNRCTTNRVGNFNYTNCN